MHSRKCAGSTMEVMLNNFLGPNDIQIGSWPETIRAGGAVNKKALLDAFSSPAFLYSSLRHVLGCIKHRRKADPFIVLNSLIKKKYSKELGPNSACPNASEVMKFDPHAWNEYFKFAFVRNPFDFEISDYFWRTKLLNKPIDFKEFLSRKIDCNRSDPQKIVPFPTTNWPIFTINDKLAVDYVGRFEELEKEIKNIGARLGLSLDINIVPRAKNNYRKRTNPEDFYDRESKEMVSLLHKKELDYFGYTYPY
jgi:hypothetical protein